MSSSRIKPVLPTYGRHGEAEPTEWEPVADAVMAAFQPHAEKLSRRFADRLYEDFLGSVQDYLSENATFNIGQRLASAERERRSQWERAQALEKRVLTLEAVIERAIREARRYAELYSEGPDGRNTFTMYADALKSDARLFETRLEP